MSERCRFNEGELFVGRVCKSRTYGDFKILTNENHLNVEVLFLSTGHRMTVKRKEVRSGGLKDPLYPSIFGVGYVGIGKYEPSCGKTQCMAYRCWFSMLDRCYGKAPLYKSYSDRKITVCREWLNYQVFAEWFYNNHIEGCELDKDFLGSIKGISEYSPDVCEFLPKKLNGAIVRLFKTGASLPLGVSKSGGKYVARTRVGGQEVYLGTFENPVTAFKEYRKYKMKYLTSLVCTYDTLLSDRFKKCFKYFKIYDPSPWQAHLKI